MFGINKSGDASQAAGANDIIKDSTVETFAEDVLVASRETPVIVDFWAPWCGPCKQLGPMLEKLVTAQKGKVKLVKVDIDKNQMLAQQMRIQSIPAVYAFAGGQPVDGFMGAVPESELQAFIDRLVAQSGLEGPGDDIEAALDAADEALDQGEVNVAAQVYAQIVQAEPENVRALSGLARCYVALKDFEKAKAALDLIPEDKRADPAVARVEAAIKLSESGGGDLGKARAKVEADPSDSQARFELAEALLGDQETESAIEQLIEIIARDKDWNDGAAREKLLTVFEALGATDPRTVKGRRKLSSILFA